MRNWVNIQCYKKFELRTLINIIVDLRITFFNFHQRPTTTYEEPCITFKIFFIDLNLNKTSIWKFHMPIGINSSTMSHHFLKNYWCFENSKINIQWKLQYYGSFFYSYTKYQNHFCEIPIFCKIALISFFLALLKTTEYLIN